MKFKELVSISGLGGLYQLVATKSDGAIVKNVEDGLTKFVAARSHTVTALDGIEIFTNTENIRLIDALTKIKESKEEKLDIAKADNTAIKNYFEKVLPDYDKDRVYVSDMKKIIKWYNLLNEKNLLEGTAAEEEPTETPAAKPDTKAKESKTENKTTKAKTKTTAPRVQTASKSTAKNVSKVGRGS